MIINIKSILNSSTGIKPKADDLENIQKFANGDGTFWKFVGVKNYEFSGFGLKTFSLSFSYSSVDQDQNISILALVNEMGVPYKSFLTYNAMVKNNEANNVNLSVSV